MFSINLSNKAESVWNSANNNDSILKQVGIRAATGLIATAAVIEGALESAFLGLASAPFRAFSSNSKEWKVVKMSDEAFEATRKAASIFASSAFGRIPQHLEVEVELPPPPTSDTDHEGGNSRSKNSRSITPANSNSTSALYNAPPSSTEPPLQQQLAEGKKIVILSDQVKDLLRKDKKTFLLNEPKLQFPNIYVGDDLSQNSGKKDVDTSKKKVGLQSQDTNARPSVVIEDYVSSNEEPDSEKEVDASKVSGSQKKTTIEPSIKEDTKSSFFAGIKSGLTQFVTKHSNIEGISTRVASSDRSSLDTAVERVTEFVKTHPQQMTLLAVALGLWSLHNMEMAFSLVNTDAVNELGFSSIRQNSPSLGELVSMAVVSTLAIPSALYTVASTVFSGIKEGNHARRENKRAQRPPMNLPLTEEEKGADIQKTLTDHLKERRKAVKGQKSTAS